jgi:hypothetical protein
MHETIPQGNKNSLNPLGNLHIILIAVRPTFKGRSIRNKKSKQVPFFEKNGEEKRRLVHGYLTESPTFELLFLFHLNVTAHNKDKIVLSNRIKPTGGHLKRVPSYGVLVLTAGCMEA